jgi:hypothetical protein
MQYKYSVMDRMDQRKIVSRHATHAAAERAANRLGCGDRFAIVDEERKSAMYLENAFERIHFQVKTFRGPGKPFERLQAYGRDSGGWHRIECETARSMVTSLGIPCTASGVKKILRAGYPEMNRLAHYYGLKEAKRILVP